MSRTPVLPSVSHRGDGGSTEKRWLPPGAVWRRARPWPGQRAGERGQEWRGTCPRRGVGGAERRGRERSSEEACLEEVDGKSPREARGTWGAAPEIAPRLFPLPAALLVCGFPKKQRTRLLFQPSPLL